MGTLSRNEIDFIISLLFEIVHNRIELKKINTEYNYKELDYMSIANNIIDKLI